MAITITQLKTFLAVLERGSVTAAADALVVTQPSVSSALAGLARELGCELFERAGRGIRLTEAGTAFAPYATDVIGLIERGVDAAREAAAMTGRRLRLAAVTTAAESFVPPLMRAFIAEHPDVELSLDVGNRAYVFGRVMAHDADVALSGTPASDERLSARPLCDNEIACITARNDPLAAGRPVSASALADRTWLLRERGSGTRALVEHFLASRELMPRTLTLGSNGAIRQAAGAGLGVSLLSRAAVEGDVTSGRLAEIRLRDGVPARPWFVVQSAIGPVPWVVTTFVEFAVLATKNGAKFDQPVVR